MPKTPTSNKLSTDSVISLLLGIAVVFALGILVVRYFTNRHATTQPAADKQNSTPTQAAKLPTTYTVVGGDCLWTIAEKYYQSGYNWVDLASANNLKNPDYLEVGQQLTIPDVKPIVVGQISAAQTVMLTPKHASHTVVSGDNLWTIAASEYGDGFKWVNIAAANHLTDPGLIYAGNVLTLPTIP